MAEEHIRASTDPMGVVPIPADERIRDVPTARRVPAATTPKPPSAPEYKDNTREIMETIVFVAVLVLLLKTFVAEAFVIPTGSMAPTLLGYHKKVTCEQCGYPFLLNGSSEGEKGIRVTGGYCPNCRYYNEIYRPEFAPPQGQLP